MLMKSDWCCSPARENPLRDAGLSNTRKKIWELESWFFCSIVGTCLRPAELRKLITKSRLDISQTNSDYELHQLVVNTVGDEKNRLARLVHNHLDKKYKTEVNDSVEITSAKNLEKFWKQEKANADIAGVYWAVITHPLSSANLCHDAYGRIHMLSHLLGESVHDQGQRITNLQRQYADLQSRYRKSVLDNRNRIRRKNKELEMLKHQPTQVLQAPSKCKDLHRLRTAAEDLTARLTMERLKREEIEDELQLTVNTRDRLHDKLSELESELCRLRGSVNHCVLKPTVDELPVAADNQGTAEAKDLSGRCILYVGGRTRQCGRFKQIVLKRNGKFLHHDGGLEDTNRLDAVLSKADAIMCPLDCISHNAMNKAKKHCKNNGKPLIMLEKASLTAFSAGLGRVSLA